MNIDKTGNEDLGKTFAKIEEAVNALPGSIDVSDLTIATADGSDAATTQALANATKAKFNTLISRLSAAQPD
jgi:hypothetical protein